MKTVKVRVTRAFFYNGKPTKVGDTVEVPAVFGAELISAKKAEPIPEAPAEDKDPAPPKGKGGSHAG